jgi:peptidoglycan/LPS O-acetylase OafA/YrhL
MTKTNYYPQLDSIRGISFLSIFIYHAVHPDFGGNWPGRLMRYMYEQLPLAIDVFFILSSFLLTWLGIKEHEKRKQVSLVNFFKRRILRIWPLYFLFLLLSFLVLPKLAGHTGFAMTLPDPVYYFLFIANYYLAGHVFFLQILWTISVEEQFYLILGLVLRFLYRHLVKFFILFIAASLFFSVYVWLKGVNGYFHTLTYFIDFAMGGLGAFLLAKNSPLIRWVQFLKGVRKLIFYCWPVIQLLFFFLVQSIYQHDLLKLLNRYLFIAYIALLLIEQLHNAARWKMFEKNRFLIQTGRISFGLYCFHGLSITAFQLGVKHFNIIMPSGVLALLIFIFNYGAAMLSYRFLETPFLRLKDRLRMI